MNPGSLDPRKFLTQPGMLEVITASFSAGGSRPGAERGPSSLLKAGLIQQLQPHFAKINVTECSTQLPSPTTSESKVYPGMNGADLVSDYTNRLSQAVYAHVRQGKPVLTLGGDHSIAFGTLTGVARAVRERLGGREIATIYVDAHADINTPERSPSGNMHGMPVAFATGIASRETGPLSWIQSEHLINPKRLVYIGLRDVDDTEWEFIRRYGIKVFGMEEVKDHGIEKVMDIALEYVGDDTPIHLSYDIDGIDPQWAPSTGLPVPGGLSLEEGIHIAHRVRESGNLVAMDLVEVNPDVEPRRLDVTLQTGCDVICSALGAKRG